MEARELKTLVEATVKAAVEATVEEQDKRQERKYKQRWDWVHGNWIYVILWCLNRFTRNCLYLLCLFLLAGVLASAVMYMQHQLRRMEKEDTQFYHKSKRGSGEVVPILPDK